MRVSLSCAVCAVFFWACAVTSTGNPPVTSDGGGACGSLGQERLCLIPDAEAAGGPPDRLCYALMRDEEGTDCTLRLGAAAQPACDALTEERLTLYWGEEALDALCVQSGLALSAEACERVNEQPPAPGAPGDRFRDASSMRVDTSPDGAAPPEPTADPSPMLVLCTTGSWPDASALFAECPQRLRALDHCEAGQLDDRDCETLRRLETEQPCVTDAGTDDATPRRQ